MGKALESFVHSIAWVFAHKKKKEMVNIQTFNIFSFNI